MHLIRCCELLISFYNYTEIFGLFFLIASIKKESVLSFLGGERLTNSELLKKFKLPQVLPATLACTIILRLRLYGTWHDVTTSHSL